jgi:hypothetical protein
MSMLNNAEKLVPSDVRAPWFQASLKCQTDQPKPGAEEFLSIENKHAWNLLPAAFWDDYLECASVTNMPAHVLRAADHLEKLHAPPSGMRDFLVETARKRFDPWDPKKKYSPQDVWYAENAGTDTVFINTTCGVSLRAHGSWAVNQIGLTDGTCIAYFSTGPYKAVVDTLRPSIVLIVRRPEANETLQDFAARYAKDGQFIPFASSRCPATTCIALKGVQPGMYKANGDGRGRMVTLERDQPEFPGLIFESPMDPPKSGETQGLHFYHPSQILLRIPGKLFYLVLLDTAASIEEPAAKDFDFFLQNLTVE